MKNFLSILAMLSFVTPSVASLFNQNIIQVKQNNKQKDIKDVKEIYWNESHTEIEIFNEWKSKEEKIFIYNINLGQDKILDYKTFSVIDPNSVSYTKTSWGTSEYLGRPFKELQNLNIAENISQGKVTTLWEVKLSVKFSLLDVSDKSGLASMASSQKVGLSYYRENGFNYLQLFGIQYAETWWSFSGGSMWINLGQGVRLET